jgi:hypothetical protein
VLTEAIQKEFNEAVRRSLVDAGTGLTPLSIWHYEGLFDDEEPGRIVPPAEVDEDTLRSDTVMTQSLYMEAIQEQRGIPEALIAVATLIWTDEPRKLATVLSTYEGFEGVKGRGADVAGACRAMAMAIQSEFEFPRTSGQHARFRFDDALELTAKQIELKYRTEPLEQEKRLLPLQLLTTEYNIPIPLYTDGAPALVTSYLIDVLERTGRTVLSFLLSD